MIRMINFRDLPVLLEILPVPIMPDSEPFNRKLVICFGRSEGLAVDSHHSGFAPLDNFPTRLRLYMF